MNLTPTSQAIFQSFFIQKSKLQSSNHTQYKSTLSNKLGCSKIKQFHERPSSTMIQQIGSVDLSQIGLDRTRKISLNESQLTVRGIRRPFKISSSIEYLNTKKEKLDGFRQLIDNRHHLQLIKGGDYYYKNKYTRINSPEQEKEIKNIKRLKLQLLSRDSKYPKFQLNLLKNKLQNQDGVCEYNQFNSFCKIKSINLFIREANVKFNSWGNIQFQVYFNDKHFHKQKNIPELSDQIRIIITREQQTLEPLDMCRIEKFRNYH